MKIKLLLQVSLTFFVVIMLGSCTSSRKSIGIEAGWELLGEKKVNYVRNVDEIVVNSGNLFTAIRFRVEDRDVNINYVKIHYTNGDKLEPQVDNVIGADQNSRIIELAADGKSISKVEFRYRTAGTILRGRATVLVFGKRYSMYGY